MTGKEIVMAMVNGLQKEHVEVAMFSFGGFGDGVCYGCAATNTICEINGKSFDEDNIKSLEERAKFLKLERDQIFLENFEEAIDNLRLGSICSYNYIAYAIGIAILPIANFLPALRTSNYKEDLQAYIDYANSLED